MTVRFTVGLPLLAAVLTACGTSSAPGTAPSSAPAGSATGSTLSHTKGLPPTVTPTDTAGQSLVGWTGPGRMYLVTYGSGSCPKLPTSVSATGNQLTITTALSSDGPCTMDFGPTTSVVDVPQGIDDALPVQVTIDGVASTVPPR